MFAYVQGTSRFCNSHSDIVELAYVVLCEACVGSPAWTMFRSSELLCVRTPLPSASTPPLNMYFTSSNGLARSVPTNPTASAHTKATLFIVSYSF